MHYFRSYGFMFKSPNWMINMLIIILSFIVPIVGPIVAIGYFFAIIEHMHRRGSDETYPDFDFNRLTSYLLPGLWPFLAEFLLSLPLLIYIFAAYIGVLFMALGVDKKQFDPELMVAISIGLAAVGLLLIVITALVRIPIYLKAGLQQEFAAAFSWAFYWDFMGRVGVQTVLLLLFEMFTAPFIAFAGMLLCFIGIYPANAMIIFGQHHLLYQLYQVYLREGGTPIPLKPEEQPERDYGEEIVEDERTYPE
jgi:signal transduction histidine kinase